MADCSDRRCPVLLAAASSHPASDLSIRLEPARNPDIAPSTVVVSGHTVVTFLSGAVLFWRGCRVYVYTRVTSLVTSTSAVRMSSTFNKPQTRALPIHSLCASTASVSILSAIRAFAFRQYQAD